MPRTSGLLFAILLLIAVIPDAVGRHTPRGAPVVLNVPAAIAAPPPEPLTAPDVAAAGPLASPEPPPIPLEDLADELRVARGESRARPAPTPPETPAAALAALQAMPAPHLTPGGEGLELYVRLPAQSAPNRSLRILLALHGMGGRGDRFAENLIPDCDRNGWVLVAPTLPYKRDYMDPNRLLEEDLRLGHQLHALLDSLPQRLGLKLRRHVLVYGFSRGAQLAHRFALFHPAHVESLVLISAGSYTMPIATSKGNPKPLAFPYGIGDLPSLLGQPLDWESFIKLSFWIAVGEKDNRKAEVPRAFDPYSGSTRVERARAFSQALESVGVDTHLTVFPNADHEVTGEMRSKAVEFLRKDELTDNWND